MLVEGRCDLGDLHATVPLLDHLGIGDKSIEGDVNMRRLECSQEAIESDDDASNGIVGVQVAMEKAVEVDREDIDVGWRRPFNGGMRTDEGPNIKGDPHTKRTRDGSNSERPAPT